MPDLGGGAPSELLRHRAMLLYVCISLSITMFVQQTSGIERGSWQYLVYIGIAVGLPLLSIGEIAGWLFRRGWVLLIWLFWAGVWFFAAADDRAVGQLALLIWVTAWIATGNAALGVRDLGKAYVALIVLGICVLSFTSLNEYGLVPGKTIPEYGIWRVSFFPNVAYSGILSLAMILILTRDRRSARAHWFLILLAAYFLVFSFVRAAFLSAVLYLALRWWFSRWLIPNGRRMFWISLLVAFGCIALTVTSAKILYLTQDIPGVSVLLLRGERNLTLDQIAYQLYRPWLWSQQWELFSSSPWLMGWGSSDFHDMVARKQADPDSLLISAGTEALLLRLLVVYGFSGLLFSIFLIKRLHGLALADDRWACACFPAVFTLMMSWGSVFHPSDSMFVIFLLIMIKGSRGFPLQEPLQVVPLERGGTQSGPPRRGHSACLSVSRRPSRIGPAA
jgi:hypothetical protein